MESSLFFPSLFPSSATAIGSARERAVTRGQIPVDQKKRKEFFLCVYVCFYSLDRPEEEVLECGGGSNRYT